MFEEFIPKRKIGFLAPLSVIDHVAYQFYRMAPEGMAGVWLPIGLQEFSPKDVERVFAPLDTYLALLVERGVHMIVQVGVPLPILMGLDFHDKLLKRIEAISGLPATSTVMNVVNSAKSMGIRRIALANKWSPVMNRGLEEFFKRDGIQVTGVYSQSMSAGEIVKMKNDESISMAYQLGRGALEKFPDADGVYIGGGAWLIFPVAEPLEKEFGKPVIHNENATIWDLCRLLNYGRPVHGYGRLLEQIQIAHRD